MENLDQLAVTNFQEYLRIRSVQPNVNYEPSVSFLERQAESLELPLRVYYCFPNKPIVIITWAGTEPTLPSILLNSHMDVVPVNEENWTFDPFGADIDDQGNIYARGAQDMKSVGIQYLEAVRRLRRDNVTLKRTIHISFMPDEEIGSFEGMREFIKSEDYRNLNVGFGLDEGIASPDAVYNLFYGERTARIVRVICPGQTGHGSLLLTNTAGEKLRKILDRFADFRDQERNKLECDSSLTIGDVTTVNVTMLEGGVQSNVIPPSLAMIVDCRIPITVDLEEFERMLDRWCEESGEGVRIEYLGKQPATPVTKLDDSNPFWVAFKAAADDLDIELKPQIFSGSTDSRSVRAAGAPALGFSPMNNTLVRLHDDDEYLNRDVFLRGIEIYYEIISAVADVDEVAV